MRPDQLCGRVLGKPNIILIFKEGMKHRKVRTGQPHLSPWEDKGANPLETYLQPQEGECGDWTSQDKFTKGNSCLTN